MKKILLITFLLVFVISGTVLGATWQEKLSFNGNIYYTDFASKITVDGNEESPMWPDYVQDGITTGMGYNVRGFYAINDKFSVGLGYDSAKGKYTEDIEKGFSRISGFELVGTYMINPMFKVGASYVSYTYRFEAKDEGDTEPFYTLDGNGPGYKVDVSYLYELENEMDLNIFAGYRMTDIDLTKENTTDISDENAKFDMSGYFVGAGITMKF